MISYKDMTFCPFWRSCKDGNTCHRALTKEIIKKAHAWWGNKEAPICKFAEKPNCYDLPPKQ